ncbi:unnamed protein product [Symbiodinium sp. CCMP2592]|nr:unnamed protein product [Symbiodinium sp. CCMP2592]
MRAPQLEGVPCGQGQLAWARCALEVRAWLRRLIDEGEARAQEAGAQAATELLERGGALALLFLARQAKARLRRRSLESEAEAAEAESEAESEASEALRDLRLLAFLLQKQALRFRTRAATAASVESASEDWRWVLAATLRPWLCEEWCSPRVEVVDYRPCCGTGGLLLASDSDCDHSQLRAVLDIVVSAPALSAETEPELGRQRVVHRGPWHGFRPTEGGWHASFGPPGSALHRWEEVTAAGLAVLAAAYSATSMSRDGRDPTPLPLLCYGVGDGLLCTFLAQHAPEVRVEVLEPEVVALELAERHFGLRLAGNSGRGTHVVLGLEGQGSPGRSLGETDASGSFRYAAVVALGRGVAKPDWEPLRRRCEAWEVPAILLEAPCGVGEALRDAFAGFRVLELQDLESCDECEERDQTTDETSIFLLTRGRGAGFGVDPGSQKKRKQKETDPPEAGVWPGEGRPPASFLDVLSPKRWFDLLLARGGVRGGAPDVLDAQRSQVVSAGFLSAETLGFLERLAARAAGEGCGRAVRSAQSEAWQVTFLQTRGFFAREAPELLESLAEMARSVGLREHWLTVGQAERMKARVVEWHDQEAPGPGIPDPRHYDMDSLVTLDVLCAEPKEDFEGGELRTLETDGSLKEQSFGFLEVLVFQAHKYHMVAPVTRGRRRALVLEFWDGPARACPHRCISFEERCPLEPEGEAEKSLWKALPAGTKRENTKRGGKYEGLVWIIQLEMPLLSLANITLSSARHVSIAPHEPGGGANPVEGRRSWRFRNTGARIKGPIATFPEAVDVGVGDIGLFQDGSLD